MNLNQLSACIPHSYLRSWILEETLSGRCRGPDERSDVVPRGLVVRGALEDFKRVRDLIHSSGKISKCLAKFEKFWRLVAHQKNFYNL